MEPNEDDERRYLILFTTIMNGKMKKNKILYIVWNEMNKELDNILDN
jgi:hypothetical protein